MKYNNTETFSVPTQLFCCEQKYLWWSSPSKALTTEP